MDFMNVIRYDSYPNSEFASLDVTTEKVVDGKWLDFALDMTVEYYKDTDGLSTTASTIYRNVAVSSEEAGRSAKWDEFLEIFYLIAHDGYAIPDCKSRQNKIDGALEVYRYENNLL